ncbi:All-trans-zeta-carotene desaturase [Nocardioides aquaticus]|uniref:All-trans-zeta-carotene desaturase n=2 Tax=Nocardioides aquaticus TaxID=160826 RepID=A0ABX8EPQ3_9ACTN|nr:All-trans-zeta-carotene desaturase [Nocardioides aquaticus]
MLAHRGAAVRGSGGSGPKDPGPGDQPGGPRSPYVRPMSHAVVVGSGPNGLAAAIRLARAGMQVTVLERAAVPGGGVRTSELTLPGLLHDDCSAFHPMGVLSPFLSTLGLERYGLTWRWPEIDLAHPLDDGRAGLMSRDMATTVASLGADGARWEALFGPLARDFEHVAAEAMGPVLHLPRHPVSLVRFGLGAALPATVLARAFRDEPARSLLLGIAAHAFNRLDTPLSSAVGLLLGAAGHRAGWPVAEGGSQAIATAMIALLESLGGRVVTGTEVTDLDQVRELAGLGAERPAAVVLDTSPDAAVQILGERMPAGVRRQLGRYRYGPSAYKVDVAVEGGVPWTNPDARRAGTLHLGGSAAEVAATEGAVAKGVMPERPFVLVGQQHLADPTRSRGDVHPLWLYAHVPHAYDRDATEATLDQVERFAPGFRERVVAVHTRDPAALEAHDPNYVGGDIGVGANTLRQLVLRPRPALDPYSLGLRGVVLCSSATPPGGGVHGMCGHGAAESVLRQVG